MTNILDVVRTFWEKRHRETHFRAIVADKAGNTIQIQRLGHEAADVTFYAAAKGLAASVDVGDYVLVVDLTGSGSYVVVCEIVS